MQSLRRNADLWSLRLVLSSCAGSLSTVLLSIVYVAGTDIHRVGDKIALRRRTSVFGRKGFQSREFRRETCHPGDNVILALMELTPARDKREEILELLQFSADRLEGKPGCLSSGVYEARDDKQTILYLERWESEEALHRHIQSNLYLGVLNAIDLAMEPREISFHEISDTKSMELIVALRTASVG